MKVTNDNSPNLEYLAGVQLRKRGIKSEKILNVNRPTKEERIIQWFMVVEHTMRTLQREWMEIQEMDR